MLRFALLGSLFGIDPNFDLFERLMSLNDDFYFCFDAVVWRRRFVETVPRVGEAFARVLETAVVGVGTVVAVAVVETADIVVAVGTDYQTPSPMADFEFAIGIVPGAGIGTGFALAVLVTPGRIG